MSIVEVSQPWCVYEDLTYRVREIWRGDLLLVKSTIVSCKSVNSLKKINSKRQSCRIFVVIEADLLSQVLSIRTVLYYTLSIVDIAIFTYAPRKDRFC